MSGNWLVGRLLSSIPSFISSPLPLVSSLPFPPLNSSQILVSLIVPLFLPLLISLQCFSCSRLSSFATSLFSPLLPLHVSPLLPHPLVSLNLISPVVYFLIFLSFLPPPLVFSHFLFSPFPGLTSPLTSISPCLSHLFCPPLLHSPPSSFVSSCPSRLPSLLLSGLVNMLIAITSHCCCLISPSLHL